MSLRTLRLLPLLLALAPGIGRAQLPPLQDVPTVRPASVTVQLEPVVADLQLPVTGTAVPDGSGRILIGQLDGVVRVLQDGKLAQAPFLDLTGRVTALRGEDGFYSLALHPDFASNGRVFAAYVPVGEDDMIVTEYRASADRSQVDPTTERTLLRIPVDQPFHHGGQILFGPDGMLYVSTGDGQEENHWLHEPPFVSQDLGTLRGKILRIDVDHGDPYAIPKDNPFVGREGARGEVWALGFRNPWKMSFDAASGTLWVSDVGNDRWEEVDRVVPGGNYGWPMREGPECQLFPDTPGLVDPACGELPLLPPSAAYGHPALDPEGGNAVTGGYVVHGPAAPALEGRYLFGDFVSGRLWSLAHGPDGDSVELLLDTDLAISGFVQAANGDVYVLSMSGSVARVATP